MILMGENSFLMDLKSQKHKQTKRSKWRNQDTQEMTFQKENVLKAITSVICITFHSKS